MSLYNLINVGLVSQADDSEEIQALQITQKAAGSGFMDRVLDRVRHVFSFGFTSVPPIGSVVAFLCRGGDRSNTMAFAIHHAASRPRGLQPGDSAMYDVRGVILKFTADGPILDCAGLPLIIRNASKVTIDVPEVEITGSLTVQGAFTAQADATVDGDLSVAGTVSALTGGHAIELGALRDKYDAHKHTGVTTGTGTSGPTDSNA